MICEIGFRELALARETQVINELHLARLAPSQLIWFRFRLSPRRFLCFFGAGHSLTLFFRLGYLVMISFRLSFGLKTNYRMPSHIARLHDLVAADAMSERIDENIIKARSRSLEVLSSSRLHKRKPRHRRQRLWN